MKYVVELTGGEMGFLLSSARSGVDGATGDARHGLERLVCKLENAEPIAEDDSEHATADGIRELQRDRSRQTSALEQNRLDRNAATLEHYNGIAAKERQRLHDHGAGGCQGELKPDGRECVNPQCGWRFRL